MKHGRLGGCAAVLFVGGAGALSPGCLSSGGFVDQVPCTGANEGADCDDGNPCSTPMCDDTHHCAYTPVPGMVGQVCDQSGTTCNGSGQCASCSSAAECGTSTLCTVFTCNSGACQVTYTPPTTPLPDLTQGDCKMSQCDGHGTENDDVADPSDKPTEQSPCFAWKCVGNMPSKVFAPSGASCDGSNVCDGSGSCVECLDHFVDCGHGAYCPLCNGIECGVVGVSSACSSCVSKQDKQVTTDAGVVVVCEGKQSGIDCTLNAQCVTLQCDGGFCG